MEKNKKMYAVINSDDFNNIYLIDSLINKVDFIFVNGNLCFLFNDHYNMFDVPEIILSKARKLKTTNKIITPSDFVLLNSNNKLIVSSNNETSQEFSVDTTPADLGTNAINSLIDKMSNEANLIVWYGMSIFGNQEITTGLKQVLISACQNKNTTKYILDESTYKEVLNIDKSHECFYVEDINKFINSNDLEANNFYIKIPNKTRKELNTELINTELSEQTSLVRVPKKYLQKTKKESSRKRKKDEFASLKNNGDYVVEVSNLMKNYVSGGDKITRVLNNLNLKIKKGEFIVLFGKSGSGKSTLLNIISGLDRPTNGNVVVMNYNLPYLSNSELTKFRRKHLSFIFQQYHLLNNITGFENVETGLYLKNKKESNENTKKIIEDFFAEFELLDVINKYPSQMSGGQQQRISIMRALSKDADIIFADEPTGALDKKTSIIVLESLKRINKELNKTVIMVSHDPSVVKYATRVVSLEKGIIVKDELVKQSN